MITPDKSPDTPGFKSFTMKKHCWVISADKKQCNTINLREGGLESL